MLVMQQQAAIATVTVTVTASSLVEDATYNQTLLGNRVSLHRSRATANRFGPSLSVDFMRPQHSTPNRNEVLLGLPVSADFRHKTTFHWRPSHVDR
jgi:hypothetical protein